MKAIKRLVGDFVHYVKEIIVFVVFRMIQSFFKRKYHCYGWKQASWIGFKVLIDVDIMHVGYYFVQVYLKNGALLDLQLKASTHCSYDVDDLLLKADRLAQYYWAIWKHD